jgi:predicted ATPase
MDKLTDRIRDTLTWMEAQQTTLRERLTDIRARAGQPRRGQITVLAVTGVVDAVAMDAIQERGGTARKIGKTVVGVWVATPPTILAPEEAIRSALALGVEVRAGVTTAMATPQQPPMKVAQTLAADADAGKPIIDHATYQEVRGIFDVVPVASTPDIGRAYAVLAAKRRVRPGRTRRVEGIETQMVGRDHELATLKAIYRRVRDQRRAALMTITGEAGIGKSRLLYEFNNWLDLLPERTWSFEGRATRQMRTTPYGLLRDLLAQRFGILTSQSPEKARERFLRGVVEFMRDPAGREKAAFIGHIIGLDFSLTPYLAGVRDDPAQINSRARHHVAQFIRGVHQVTGEPLAIFLEDIHWADDASLGLVQYIARHCHDIPLLIVALARPSLFERLPEWGQPIANAETLTLRSLTHADSRALAQDILQHVDHLPGVLREMISGSTMGNPFYIEELIGLLIDMDVIVKTDDMWYVAPDRLMTVDIPATLPGVIQARLANAPEAVQATMGQGAAVGRVFWRGALAHIGETSSLESVLDEMKQRELVVGRTPSTFTHDDEWMFKHSILHDIAYRSTPEEGRRRYHRLAAEWLIEASGDRVRELLHVIAEQYTDAGDSAGAVEYLRRAGEQATAIGTFTEALTAYENALDLLDEGATVDRAALLHLMGDTCRQMNRITDAETYLRAALDILDNLDAPELRLRVVLSLAHVFARRRQFDEGEACARTAVDLAEATDDRTRLILSYQVLAQVLSNAERFQEAITLYRTALDRAEATRDLAPMCNALTRIGINYAFMGELSDARHYLKRALAIAEDIFDRQRMSTILLNLAELARQEGDLDAARDGYEASLDACNDIGATATAAINIINLGLVALDMEDYPMAREYFLDVLAMSRDEEAFVMTYVLYTLICFARLWSKTDDPNSAMTLLGLVLNHPELDHQARSEANALVRELEETHGARLVQIGLQSGRALQLDKIIQQILERR